MADGKSGISGKNAQPPGSPSTSHPFVRYTGAIGLVFLAWALTAATQPLIAPAAFPFFLLAIIGSATFFGLGPGLLAAALAGGFAELHLIHFMGVAGSPLRLGMWLAEGALVCFITDRHQRARDRAEAHARSVQESEERFRVAIEASPNGILMVNDTGAILLVNREVERMFGYSRDELLGQQVEMLVPEVTKEKHPTFRDGFSYYPHTRRMGRGSELFGRHRDGSDVPLEVGLNPIDTDAGLLIMASIVDITTRKKEETERNQLEIQLRQAQRMEAIGNLAGGIAHDFNNILTAIITNAQLLLLDQKRPADDIMDLNEIVNNGVRAAGLTRQLLTFSRRQMVTHVVSVYMTLREMVPMLRRLIGEDITIQVEAHPDTGTVWADQSQVEQLILNLVVNARDAMPQGGEIHISARPHEVKGRADLPDGSYVEIVVTDTGEGMNADVVAHAFDPFFTTKRAGTGLGLSTVYGIVQQARGHVIIESEVGRGSKFTVWLPALEQGALVVLPDVTPEKIDGDCCVLLVEDELTVQQALKRALTEWRYRVITADNGREAQEVLRTNQVHVVVTDVVMPDMGGRQLGEFIAHEYPALPVIYMTGYTTDEMIRRGMEQGKINFIQKPFDFKLLITTIQDLLGQNQTANN